MSLLRMGDWIDAFRPSDQAPPQRLGAFFQWSLERLVASGWRIDQLSFDLHESELSDDYKILTPYEERWLGEGRITQFVRARAKIAI